MKKLFILFLLPILCACEKDDIVKIDAPALPAQALYWSMPGNKVETEMQNAGYTKLSTIAPLGTFYIHHSDNNVFWAINSVNGLTSLTYYYCGNDKEWARNFWANIAGFGDSYYRGMVSWNKVRSNPITTTNSVITLDTADSQSISVNNTKYTSTITAVYKRR